MLCHRRYLLKHYEADLNTLSAHSLNGSLIVNPWNTAETGEAIHRALTMPKDEKRENHDKLYRYVSQYTAAHWGSVCRFSHKRAVQLSPELIMFPALQYRVRGRASGEFTR